MNLYLRLIVISGILVVWCNLVSSSSLEKTKTELNTLYKKMEEKKKYIRDLKEKEESLKGKLSLVNKKTEAKKKEIALINKKIKITQQNLANLKYELFQIQRQLVSQNRILQDNIKILYEYSSPVVDNDIFEYLKQVALKNNKIYNEFINKKDIISQNKRTQEGIYNVNLRDKKYSEDELYKIKKEHNQYRGELVEVLNERVRKEKEVKKLKLASLELERLLVRLSSKKKEERVVPVALALAGRDLLFPVEGGRIKRGYGQYKHEKFNATMFNKGVDIVVPYGSKVSAVDEGKVVYADYFEGYGKLIIIDHGLNLCSIYAYLDKILVTTGEKVKKGRVIGQVGNLREDYSSNFHFGLRLNGKSINPLAYISK